MADKATVRSKTRERTHHYFCRPCGFKHQCPTNAKCPRQQQAGPSSKADTREPEGDASRRDETDSDGSPIRLEKNPDVRRKSTGKRKRFVSTSDSDNSANIDNIPGPSQSDDDNVSMKMLLNRLEAISHEGKQERQRLARESEADRAYFRSALQALKNGGLSDEEADDQPRQGKSSDRRTKQVSHAGETLPTGPQALAMMRSDAVTARTANAILHKQGVVQEDSTKRLKSGFNLTINDSATVVAQWPQMNVYRAPNDTATYDSLSINEFSNGFLLFVLDCLNLPVPDVTKAIDYLDYLRDLFDDIPLVGWSGVKDAHGEVLRSIEQGRLIWSDIPARTKAIGKALRRAHLAVQAKVKTKGKSSDSGDKTDQKGEVKKPCPEYQSQECSFKANHSSDGIKWLHCCATCLRVRHQRYSHPKAECNRQKALEEKAVPKN